MLKRGGKIEAGHTTIERIIGLIIPVAGIILCAFLLLESGVATVTAGIATLSIGVPIYIAYSPRKEMEVLKREFYSTEAILSRVARTQRVFLEYLLRLARSLLRRMGGTHLRGACRAPLRDYAA